MSTEDHLPAQTPAPARNRVTTLLFKVLMLFCVILLTLFLVVGYSVYKSIIDYEHISTIASGQQRRHIRTWDIEYINWIKKKYPVPFFCMPEGFDFNDKELGEREYLILGNYHKLIILNFYRCRFKPTSLPLFSNPENVLSFRLDTCDLISFNIEQIKQFKNIKYFKIKNCLLTDQQMEVCCKLKNLLELDLSNNKITDIGLMELRDLFIVENLDLSGNQIQGSGLKHLRMGVKWTPGLVPVA